MYLTKASQNTHAASQQVVHKTVFFNDATDQLEKVVDDELIYVWVSRHG